MRLKNDGTFGKYQYRVVLDTKKKSTNYIERTTGVYYDSGAGNHRCLKCMEESVWINWRGDRYAKDVCKCGQTGSIEIMSFSHTATELE